MRKALIGIILAATVMTPVAAQAQRGHRGGGDRGSWSERNNGGDSARTERTEARQQRSEQQPQQQQEAPRPRPNPQVYQSQNNDGGSRGGWNRGGNNDGGERRTRGGDGGNRGDWNRGGNNDGGTRSYRGGGDGERRTRREQPSVYPQAWQGNPNDPRLQRYRDLEQRNQNADGRRGDRDGRRDWRGDRDGRRDWRGDRDGRRNWRNDWNRGWRNDNRYNWSFWRTRNRSIFRLSPYYSPYRNWSYRRFSIGLFLDSLFYSQRYWIADPWQYRLPAAPYGTQWVRYYNDVLLVDIYTGEVIDVIYDFFW